MLIDSSRLRPTLQENTGKSPEVMEDKHRFKVKVEKKKVSASIFKGPNSQIV